jgi:hypothetical protein
MDRFDDDILFDELRVVRPTPRPEFTAELDERAAAGFPRRSPRQRQTLFGRLFARRRETSLRGRLLPIGAAAIVAVAIATTVVAISGHGGGTGKNLAVASENSKLSRMIPGEGGAIESAGSKEITEASGSEVLHAEGPAAVPTQKVGGSCAKGTPGCNGHGKFEGNFFGEASSGGAEESSEAEEYVKAQRNLPGVEVEPFSAAVAPHSPGHREIERSASVVLGTKPGEVSAAAAKVYTAVHAASGVVLHSSVQSGSKGATGASFSLLIPSRKVDDALAAFSSIAEVRERHDATDDITEPTVGAAEELADSNAAIEGLLKELAGVETEAERESVEARLREERRRHASIRASLDHLNERAAMSEVTVRIVTGRGAGVTPAGKGSDGDWSVGDALHDAGQILTIAAGIIVVALAILAPIALIALALWLTNRFRLRRRRERVLG